MLDNIPHIKAYWAMLGVKTAQIALWFGADDLDGTVEEEKIYKMAGSRAPEALTRSRAGAPHPRRRAHAGRARHALQRRRRGRRARRGRCRSSSASRSRCWRERREAATRGGAFLNARPLIWASCRAAAGRRARSSARRRRARAASPSASAIVALSPVAACARQGDLVAVPGVASARARRSARCCWSPRCRSHELTRSRSTRVAHLGDAGAHPACASGARPAASRATRRVRRRSWSAASTARAAPLIIGDAALQAVARAQLPVRLRSRRAWRALTGLPFVFAVWAGRARRRRRRACARCSARSLRPRPRARSTRSPPTPAATASHPSARSRYLRDELCVPSRRRSASPAPTSSCARGRAAGLLAAGTRCVWSTRTSARRRRRPTPPRTRRATARACRAAEAARRIAGARRPLRARRRRRSPPPRAPPRRRGHLHHRSQHQLHERLHHRLPLLRLLPQPGDTEDGYVLSREELGEKIQETVDAGGVQILLQGGLNPELPHRAGTKICSAG